MFLNTKPKTTEAPAAVLLHPSASRMRGVHQDILVFTIAEWIYLNPVLQQWQGWRWLTVPQNEEKVLPILSSLGGEISIFLTACYCYSNVCLQSESGSDGLQSGLIQEGTQRYRIMRSFFLLIARFGQIQVMPRPETNKLI